MKRYRAAIIGTGGISRIHAEALKTLAERVELVACVDIDQERVAQFAQNFGVPHPFTDVDEMLGSVQPDVVHVCTPPNLHAELSIKAVKAGAWVLCEKPLCASLAELDAIQKAEAETGKYVSSVFQHRFGPGAAHLRQLIQEEAMGRLLVGLCNTTWYRDEVYYAVPWRGKWETELGGPTMGHGIHQIDLFLWLLGDWEEVRAMAGTLARDIEVEDVSMAIVRFASGAMGSVTNSVLSPREESYLRFDFEKATVELSHLYGYSTANWKYTKGQKAGEEEFQRWSAVPGQTYGGHTAQIAALLDSMDKGERPLVSGHEARRTIEFITALYKAALTGRPVRRGEIVPGDPFYTTLHGGYAKPGQNVWRTTA